MSFDPPSTAVVLIYLENLKLAEHLGVFAGNEAPSIQQIFKNEDMRV
jgi:hypothetical protein